MDDINLQMLYGISKKELIISVLLILAFLVVGINTSVLATSGTLDPSQMINVLKGNNEKTIFPSISSIGISPISGLSKESPRLSPIMK